MRSLWRRLLATPGHRISCMTGFVPTLEQIDELHRLAAPSEAAHELIHGHCVVVATIARQLARQRNAMFRGEPLPDEGVTGGTVPQRLIDEELVTIGGLLHDIGTYRVLKHDGSDGHELKFDGPNYIKHGILGYQWLLEQGVDESIAQFARNHTGVGLTRESVERQGLPLPPDDYVPRTLEQEVVMVADKYNSKSIPPKFLTAEAYATKAARFGEDNRRQWLDLVEQYGVPDVPALAKRFGMRIQE